jgi:cell pole-organizing protein PopZ
MDEILSSIRQIIADDDAAGVPRRPSIQAAPPPMQAAPVRPVMAMASSATDRDLSDMLDDLEPLALSSSQIVADDDAEDEDPTAGLSFDSILADTEAGNDEPMTFAPPELVEPEDIAFDMAELEPEPEPAPQPEPEPVFTPPPAAVFRPQPTVAQAAPMPDATLSADLAEQLLEPATQAAVRGSITRLQGMSLGNAGATIESLVRDMLRPMLKEWLDENLPSVVERMVEKEIARISRGE